MPRTTRFATTATANFQTKDAAARAASAATAAATTKVAAAARIATGATAAATTKAAAAARIATGATAAGAGAAPGAVTLLTGRSRRVVGDLRTGSQAGLGCHRDSHQLAVQRWLHPSSPVHRV